MKEGGRLNLIVLSLAVLLVFLAPVILGCAPQTAAPSSSQPSTPAAKEKVKIVVGSVVNATGAYASTQIIQQYAETDYIKWVNETGYIPGVELEYRWADSASDTGKALPAFKQVIGASPKPTVVLIGSPSNGVALKSSVTDAKITSIISSGDNLIIRPPEYYFATGLPQCNEVGVFINWFAKNWKENRPAKFAWLTWDTVFGRAFVNKETEAYIKSKGIEIVGAEYIPAVPTDTTAHILRLKDAKVDVTYGGFYPPAVTVLLKDADKLGLWGKFVFGNSYQLSLTDVIKLAGPLSEGIVQSGYFTPPTWMEEKCPWILEQYKKNNRDVDMWAYAATAGPVVCAVEAIKQTVNEVGAENTNTAALYKTLSKLTNFDMRGIFVAPVTFTESNRAGVSGEVVFQIKDGKIIALEPFAKSPDLLPGGKDVPAQ